MPSEPLKFAMICYSNHNRSMEAHKLLADAGLRVVSYGVGTCVRLPGPSADKPNAFPFGTPYTDILTELRRRPEKEQAGYTRLGIFSMLERNVKIKRAPESWQDAAVDDIDVFVTFEERVMDALVDDMAKRSAARMKPALVVNLEVPDNNREALAAAPEVRARHRTAARPQRARAQAATCRLVALDVPGSAC